MASVPIRPGLFDAGEPPSRLLGGLCRDCARHHFPAQPMCPYCGIADCIEVALSERGTLFLFTVVHNPPPGYRGSAPYGLGVVELPEGLRIVSPLSESSLSILRVGMQVRLVIAPLFTDEQGREVLSYAFAPMRYEDA
jgi:uncharacterized OB-fold protein